MQLFYNPEIIDDSKPIKFSKVESKHIVKVLRNNTGDLLHITNGNGSIFTVRLIETNGKHCSAEVISEEVIKQRTYKLHMAVAPTKMNDRYEWFLEKATEIGVDTITPLLCDNSERKHVNLERYERILLSAVKQSLQPYLPKLNNAVRFDEFIKHQNTSKTLIAHCANNARENLKDAILPDSEITILIGPEGDFSTREIELALANKITPISLGSTRLRTETAAIVACTTVALCNL